jgi:hypothetical protein
MLAQIDEWFTEGFDTADIEGARGDTGRIERLAR